ncbi:MAG TPA: ATP synthase F0 subunit B [Nitrospirae bacterium]|mgnify:CR=1 FL=1|nr:ATP synthase F0 subunit B [Nitrospirota bacterium]
MIEINFTLIIQAVNFLVMLWFLNSFIFKPVLGHIDKREKKIKGISDEAERLAARGDASKVKYEEDLVSIHHTASEIIASARKQAQDQQTKILDDSKNKFKEIIENSRTRINGEMGSATDSLNKELEGFGRSMAEKILGRKMSS